MFSSSLYYMPFYVLMTVMKLHVQKEWYLLRGLCVLSEYVSSLTMNLSFCVYEVLMTNCIHYLVLRFFLKRTINNAVLSVNRVHLLTKWLLAKSFHSDCCSVECFYHLRNYHYCRWFLFSFQLDT